MRAADRHDPDADGSCTASDGTRYEQRTPSEQYAPHEWLVRPLPPGDRSVIFGETGATHVSNVKCAAGRPFCNLPAHPARRKQLVADVLWCKLAGSWRRLMT